MTRADEEQRGGLTDDALDAVDHMARRFGGGRRILWIGEKLSAREAPLTEASERLRAYSFQRPDLRHPKARARRLQTDSINPEPGSADLVVMTDSGLMGWTFERLAERLAESLAEEGTLVMGLPTPGLDLEEVDIVLGRLFPSHHLLSCRSIGGWMMADVAVQATALHVDDSRLHQEAPPPSVVIAVASRGSLALDELSLMIGPSESIARERQASEALEARYQQELEAVRSRAREHATKLEAELKETSLQVQTLRVENTRLTEQDTAIHALAPDDADTAADFAELERRLQERGERIRELEAEVERRAVLVRDLLEEMGKRDLAPEAKTAGQSEAPAPVTPSGADEGDGGNTRLMLTELRDFLAHTLESSKEEPEGVRVRGEATLVGMEAPAEWSESPPGGLDDLRARLDWVRSRSHIPGPDLSIPPMPSEGPIQLATLLPEAGVIEDASATISGQVLAPVESDVFSEELIMLHERLARLDQEIEQERHSRESLEAELARIEASDASTALHALKERLREVRDEVEASQSHPGDPPNLSRLRDLLQMLAEE